MKIGLLTPEHGTGAKYDTVCRCTECVEWNKLFLKNVVDYQGMSTLPEAPVKKKTSSDDQGHGTRKMYRKERCRCPLCMQWMRDARYKRVDAYGNSRKTT